MEVYGGALPESVLKDHEPRKVYRAVLQVNGHRVLPEDLNEKALEIERQRIHGLALKVAISQFAGDVHYLNSVKMGGEAKVIRQDDVNPLVSWLANFNISSDRLDILSADRYPDEKIMCGEVDVEAIGYFPKIQEKTTSF